MIKFGWRTPDFPLDGSSAVEFRDQELSFLQALQDHFDSTWVADHFYPWMGHLDQSTPTFECWTTLTYLSALFPKMDFGTIVMSQSYRPPALLAKMAAQLQILSGGRYILGIGAGWKENEYRSYGYDYPSAATRIHQLEEAVQIIRSMFSQPKTTFQGKYYHVENAMCEPRPDPVPPIMIGGIGHNLTLRVVAKYADWWNCVGTSVEEMAEHSKVLDERCGEIGRDPKSIVRTFSTDVVAVAPTSEAAWTIAKASPFYQGSRAAEIVGTPDEVAAKLQRFVDIGVEHFILRFMDFPRFDSAKLFIDEVLPRFR